MFGPNDFRIIFGTTKIEYDLDKEDYNRKEHKYSLTCAVDILTDAVTFQHPFITIDRVMEEGEIRHIHLAEYNGRIVLFVTTMRAGETIRVISMRDADPKEREIYKQNPPAYII
jgi:uncharacterized DUF497 family protein